MISLLKKYINALSIQFRKMLDVNFNNIPKENSDSDLYLKDNDLIYKRNLLKPYIEMIGKGSILNFGCGDLELFAQLPSIDVSVQAISFAQRKRPKLSFKIDDIINYSSSSFDYTFCIDVLFYQPNEALALELAQNLVRVARKGFFFSIHDNLIKNKIFLDSSKIRNYIETMPEISSLYEVGNYNNITLFFAEKGLGERNTMHDIGLQELVIASKYLVDKPYWKEIIAFSRNTIGFFPRSPNRIHEFLWLIEQIGNCSRKKILDLGAGVCFLPLYFTECGAKVTTVDNHPIQRNNQPKHMWNGWGFLDYSTLDCRIHSFNTDICRLDFENEFDIVYSLVVFAHMPADIRRTVISKVSNMLRPNGLLFLSIDLIPGTRLLWNFCEGQVIDKENHGSLDTIKEEINAVGIEILSESRLERMPMSRTDVGFLRCIRSPSINTASF